MAEISKQEIDTILSGYDKPKIGTIASHSALQIIPGAKDEGFQTLLITKPESRKKTYESFWHSRPDYFIDVDDFSEILDEDVQKKLVDDQVILIPHGSFVEYVKPINILKKLRVPLFGNRKVLEWESNREKQREWLECAGLKIPKKFTSPDEIEGQTFVKMGGAKGGAGFFVASTPAEIYAELETRYPNLKPEERLHQVNLQEYIVGNRYYLHYYFSPTKFSHPGWEVGDGYLYFLGADRRDETNADGLRRDISIDQMKKQNISISYNVVGNQPIYLRESLLPPIFEMGAKVIEKSKEIFPMGLIGPFCLETAIAPKKSDPNKFNIFVFEISARIVAGTSVFPEGSLYTYDHFGERLSTGRLMAREIKHCTKEGILHEICY